MNPIITIRAIKELTEAVMVKLLFGEGLKAEECFLEVCTEKESISLCVKDEDWNEPGELIRRVRLKLDKQRNEGPATVG